MSILSIKGPDKKIASLEKQNRLYCKRNGLEMVIRKSKADIAKEEAELKRQLKLAAKIKEAKEASEKIKADELAEKIQDEKDKIAADLKAKADLKIKQESDRVKAEDAKDQKKVDDANAAEEAELERTQKVLEKIKAKEADKTNGPKGAK